MGQLEIVCQRATLMYGLVSAFMFENLVRIQILLRIMTSLQVKLLEPLSLSPVYSVAVGVSMRCCVVLLEASSIFLRRPAARSRVQGPGFRVQGLLGQVALEDEQVYEGTSANTGLGTVTLVAI